MERDLHEIFIHMRPYWKRFLARLWRDSEPWARDNLIWAIFMLIAPPIAVWLREPSHEIDWTLVRTTLWIYVVVFGVYFLVHMARTARKLDFESQNNLSVLRSKVDELGAVPVQIALAIHDVVMHRTGDQESRWKNGEFLVQVSAELLNLAAAQVEYSAQLVFRGEALPLTGIRDVEKWEIIERRYYQTLHMYPNSPLPSRPLRSSFVTNPSAIAEHLTRSVRNEGWLHFQIEGMGETDIAKRTLRLYATAKGGSCYADEEARQTSCCSI